MKKTLKQLIKLRTLSRETEENEKALEWVKEQIPTGYGARIKKHNGYPLLYAGSDSPMLCLQAHIDVVPGNEELFFPKEEKGLLYGRGAYDMKFAIACYIEILKRTNPEKHGVGLLLTSDEEIGGANGVGAAIKEGYSPSFVFLPDGGDNWKFDVKAKGAWHLEISTKGKAGHASRPWEGVSAIHKLLDISKELRSHFTETKEEEFKPTINIGKIEGGEATNQIAEKALMKVDIRFTSKGEKEKIEKILDSLKEKYEGTEIKEDVYAPPFECDAKNPHFKEFEKIAREHGKSIKEGFAHGATDARHFSAENIPVMVIKPRGGGSHSKKEWVDLKDLDDFCSTLEKFVKKTTKKR